MIGCYKTTLENDRYVTREIDAPEAGCWINVDTPTAEERDWLQSELGILPEFVRSALDDEESSHVDFDDDTGQVLIIVDCPFVEDASEAEDPDIVQYDTHPLSLIFLPETDLLVTVSLRDNEIINMFAEGRMRRMNTNQRTRMFLLMLLRISQRYIVYLRNIDRQFNRIESQLRLSMENEELIKMLGFEKSLVYFTTSLKADESTLAKVNSGRFIRLYEEDRDLIDDVFIELRQAMEMCAIYTNILDSTTDTFSSVINNNLNRTMRTLTIITVVLAMPTIIFSFYGMNTDVLPFKDTWLWPGAFALVVSLLVALFFSKSKWFK